MKVAEILESQKDTIIRNWLNSLQEELPEIKQYDKSAIEDSIPDLMDAVIETLNSGEKKIAFHSEKHGVQRTSFAQYSLHHIVREYHLLKINIFNALDEQIALEPKDRNMILMVVDRSIEQSCESYHRVKKAVHVNARKIAERKADELELEGNNREEFMHSISHDLNNPLTNIKACIDLIERDPDIENLNQIFTILNRNVQQAESMIKDFLNVREVDKNTPLPLRCASVNVIEKIKDEVGTYNVASRAEIEFLPEEDELIIQVDIELLLRALNNLINNAIKHGDRNSKITIKCFIDQDIFAISVHNIGKQIPEEVQKNIFNKYYQASSDRKGWGIGLAFAKKVAESHGGEISLASEEGKGTTFLLKVPAMKQDS